MSDTPNINYRIFSKEEIDKKFNTILNECNNLTSYEEIIGKIHTTFYNRLFMMFKFDSELPELKVYRVTKVFKGFDPASIKSFSYNPKGPLNRANIEGYPVFYCSFTPAAALREMKEDLYTGEELYVSEWSIKFNKPVYAHSIIVNSITQNKDCFASELIKNHLMHTEKLVDGYPEAVRDGLKQYMLRVGDLFALPGKNNYKITSALAHDALYGIKEQNGDISMIMYPSFIDGCDGINYAIHPEFVNSSMMQFSKVLKVRVSNVEQTGINVTVSGKGEANEKGIINWKIPHVSVKEIDYQNIEFSTHNKCTFKGEQALNMPINNSAKLVKDFVDAELSKINLAYGLSKTPFPHDFFDNAQPERKHTLLMQCDHGNGVETNKPITKTECNCINLMAIPIVWSDEYK